MHQKALDFHNRKIRSWFRRKVEWNKRLSWISFWQAGCIDSGEKGSSCETRKHEDPNSVAGWGTQGEGVRKVWGGGGFRLEVSKSGQLNVRDSTANNSFPAFKSDTLHPDLFSLFLSLCKYQWTMWLVTTFIKEIVSPILLHSSFFFWPKEVSSIETFNGHYLNITNASVIG